VIIFGQDIARAQRQNVNDPTMSGIHRFTMHKCLSCKTISFSSRYLLTVWQTHVFWPVTGGQRCVRHQTEN
jgi:CxxC motif-containing protein (DUF1111 family)